MLLVMKACSAMRHAVAWFRDADLRLLDNKALYISHSECDLVDNVYCFDVRNYMTSRETGEERVSFRRLRFLVESVSDIRKNLRARGSNLRVFVGKPEECIASLLLPESTAVYCSEDVTSEEQQSQQIVAAACIAKNPQVVLKTFWSGTLVDKADLPFPLNRLDIFTSFRKAAESADIIHKPSLEVPVLKPQSSSELGFDASEALDVFIIHEKIMGALGLPVTYALTDIQPDERAVLPFVGGETAAMERLEYYCTVGRLDRYKQTRNGMVGGDYSTKLSPWLALGCISARTIYHSIKNFEASTGIANEDTYWVIFELLWRDYMRFYALKHGTRLFKLLGPQGIAAKTKYPWRRDLALFNAWAQGRLSTPYVWSNFSASC